MNPETGSNPGGRLPGWLPWSIVLLVLIAATAVWLGRGQLFGSAEGDGGDEGSRAAGLSGESADSGNGDAASAPGGDAAGRAAAARSWERVLGRIPDEALDLGPVEPAGCDDVERDLAALCELLAAREGRDEPAEDVCAGLRAAAARLAARPPLASGEGAAAELMVGNVVHLARVLGPTRALRWGRLAASTAEEAEPVAWVLFRFVRSRATCEPEHPLAASDAVGDYAVALLGTVGGSAYLARRMPAQAELARLYALVLIDETGAARRHGLDPRPHLARTRAALERLALLHRDDYLDRLESIEREWRAR